MLDLSLEGGVDPELATQFIEMSDSRMEELRIEFNYGEPLAAFENRVMPMFQSGRWRRLRKLRLPNIEIPEVSMFYLLQIPELTAFIGWRGATSSLLPIACQRGP
jgi:hypothetical protein